MSRFSSFNEEAFYKAISEKDYERLKTCIISAIRNNPEFRIMKDEKVSEVKMAITILKEKVPEMFDEEYQLQDGERAFDEKEFNKWDEEYFVRQTFWLGENFCLKRITHLQKIGRWISRGIAPNAKESNFQEPQEQCQEVEKYQPVKIKVNRNPSKTKPLLMLGTIVLIIIVLVVIIAVVK